MNQKEPGPHFASAQMLKDWTPETNVRRIGNIVDSKRVSTTLKLGTPPIVARVVSCVFWLRSNLSKLRLQGGKESPVCPSCKMRRDSGEFLAFPNPTGTLLSEAHSSSPQLSCVKVFVPHAKWPRQWGTSCVPESHWHAAFRSSCFQPPTIVCQGFCHVQDRMLPGNRMMNSLFKN